MSVSNFWINGLLTPPVTPFKENEDLDLEKVKDYVDFMVRFGVPNAFVCGTTGECNSMTVAERKLLAETWVKEAKGKLSAVIVQVGTGNLKDSIELAKHAESLGVDAISCVGPSYHKPVDMDDYVEYMRRVAAAAPNTPFLLYDIDFYTGIRLDTNDFFHKGRKVIPTLKGTKHTSPDFPSMHRTHMDHREAGIQVLMGTDDTFLEGLAIGLETTICSAFFGKLYNRMKAAFDKGDMETARKEQGYAVKVGTIRKKLNLGVENGSRAILKLSGLDLGPPRLPVHRISAETEAALKTQLQAIGFFEWSVK